MQYRQACNKRGDEYTHSRSNTEVAAKKINKYKYGQYNEQYSHSQRVESDSAISPIVRSTDVRAEKNKIYPDSSIGWYPEHQYHSDQYCEQSS